MSASERVHWVACRRPYGYDVAVASRQAAVRAVFDSPLNFLATSNGYSDAGSSKAATAPPGPVKAEGLVGHLGVAQGRH